MLGSLQRLALRDIILVEQFTGEDVGTEGQRHIREEGAVDQYHSIITNNGKWRDSKINGGGVSLWALFFLLFFLQVLGKDFKVLDIF